ncbi:MAG: FAD-binding oxidoreductase [Synechocystis sp.]|nr:FAD-binding oxidoreductase [Synechocystis sp.]
MANWQAIAQEWAATGVQVVEDPHQCQRLSTDFHHFSPILTPQLQGKRADVVVLARSEAEVIRLVQSCVAQQIPLTVRGAGTGNYGQAVPLAGGVVLDLSQMQTIIDIKPGQAIAEPGVKLARLDQQAQALGWELRMAPSTYQTATLGGFVGGGSAGMGSITYGLLSEPGNVQALRVVTMEAEPRVLTLEGGETKSVLHAYGTNGIITQLTVPLAPALPWAEAIVSFTKLETAIAFGEALAACDGIVKKQIAVQAAPIPSYFSALKQYVTPGCHWVMAIVSEGDWAAFTELVALWQGEIVVQQLAQFDGKPLNLLEFNWNHTTLLARANDPALTYLQVFYQSREQVLALQRLFGDEVMTHLEIIRVNGRITLGGLPLVRFTHGDRLQEIIAIHQAMGASVANPHDYTLEGGSSQPLPPEQLALKYQTDPLGLLNPGKMSSFTKSPPNP